MYTQIKGVGDGATSEAIEPHHFLSLLHKEMSEEMSSNEHNQKPYYYIASILEHWLLRL